MQDPNPLPWGALDRFQAQFIVRKNVGSSGINYTAKTSLKTKGHFGSKVITKVEWNGYGDLATKLNSDSELNEMIAKQTIRMQQSMLNLQILQFEFVVNGIIIFHLVSPKNYLKFMTALQVTLNLFKLSTNLVRENLLYPFLLE